MWPVQHATHPPATDFVQSVLAPVQCLRVQVTIHQEAGADAYCLALEATDAHTGELLAKQVDPAATYRRTLSWTGDVGVAVTVLLRALLDPDPF